MINNNEPWRQMPIAARNSSDRMPLNRVFVFLTRRGGCALLQAS